LEKTIIKVCHDFAIESSIICGLPGVWVEENRKIAAIGLHATRNVTMHGIAINCDVDLKWFQHIIPCGIKDKSVTSISNELKRNISINHVLPHFIQAFKQQFNCEIKE
jgi:lipoyl(octanoyl) transferase